MVSARSPRSTNIEGLLSQRGRNVPNAPITDPRGSAKYVSFIYGFPDPPSLPNATVGEAAVRALAAHPDWALQYGKTSGVPELVDVLLAKINREQGFGATPDNVMITAGGSQAIQLVLELLVDQGDTVIVESPTWMGFIDAINTVGGKLVQIPLDEFGMQIATLESELLRLTNEGERPKLIYVMANFQNPTGISTSVERRRQLIDVAERFGVLILEDDAYHDLRFEGEHLPSIYGLDNGGSTLYLGTLSKIMGAGMRIGWLIGPAEIINRLAALKFDGGTNIFGSFVAAEWIPEHLDDHLDTLKTIYGGRRNQLLGALARYMPAGTTWTEPAGGFFVWASLPVGIDSGRMLAQARERGIEYLPGATCYTNGLGANQMRLSFSFAQDDQIERGIEILGELVRAEMLELGIPTAD